MRKKNNLQLQLQTLFLTLFFLSSPSISSSNQDSEALLSFKLTTNNSNSLSSWSNSSNPCNSWQGVACRNNRVTRLVLENLNLTGFVQPLTQLKHLRLLSLKNNQLSSSSFSLDFSSWKSMKLLYLSHNKFVTGFPSGIQNLSRLRRVDLSYNGFYGEIPVGDLVQLPYLLTLRLEKNSFVGRLEREELFKNVEDFNVSFNNLSGEIPKSLAVFPVTSFIGNKNLCGKPLGNRCLVFQSDPIPIKVPFEHKERKLSGRALVAIFVTYVFAVVALGVGVFLYCRKRKGRKGVERKDGEYKKREGYEEMVLFQGCKGYKVDDLLKGSAEMLGKGSVGSTYKVVMECGDVVVVKRATRERKKKKEMEGLLREIGGLKHKNIVSLRGYYYSTDELLFVYDFLPNGSLHSLLHGNRWQGRTPLDWTKRLKFASDIAEGLAFLHNECKSKLSHGHLTSSNVVIDEEGNACLSDVALELLFLPATQPKTTYNAPELMLNSAPNSRKFSHTNDIYSFGVILLEILTDKVATGEGETSLIKWVKSLGRGQWASEVFDFELLRYKDMEDEMVALMEIALLCLAPAAQDRPKISAVRKLIEDIRGGTRHSVSPNDLTSDSSPSLSEDTNFP